MVKGGDAGVAHPSWLDLINGDTYKVWQKSRTIRPHGNVTIIVTY